MNSTFKTNKWMIFLAVFLLTIGFIISGFWKSGYDGLLFSKLSLSDGSETFETWKETAVPLYIKFHFFNWTNPEESLKKQQRPNFVQVGPYVFREHRSKCNITWNSNDTITYNDIHRWNFMANMSNGSLSDEITTINMMAVVVLSHLKYSGSAAKHGADAIVKFNEQKLYVRKKASELLFDGYDDKLIDLMKILKKIGIHINVPFDKFGWWYGKNMTSTGIFNMFSGVNNINLLGELYSRNYRTNCGSFEAECDRVYGTIGEVWSLNSTIKPAVFIFVPDLCSSFKLSNSGSRTIGNLEGTHFIGLADVFDNGTKVKETRCYCPNYDCQYASGVRNVSSCLNGSPTFISYPHFYLADESYRSNITGMEPDEEKHAFHVTLEKNTGILIEVNARLQINVFLEPLQGISMIENVPEMYVPIVWFDQYAVMPESILHRITFLAVTIPNILRSLGFMIVCCAAVFLIFTLIKRY